MVFNQQIPKLQVPIENDVIKTENNTLKIDIESAKEQIRELEKALLVVIKIFLFLLIFDLSWILFI